MNALVLCAIKLRKVLFHILNFAHFIFKLEGGGEGCHNMGKPYIRPFMIFAVLTFTAHASYPLCRHLNISALPQAQRSRSLGQPPPQPFKYFALKIFREISLIFSTTLEVFPASCSDWSIHWEKTTCILFLYEAVCTQSVRLVLIIYKLFFFAPFGWLGNDLFYRLSMWPRTIWVIAIWWQATVSRTL